MAKKLTEFYGIFPSYDVPYQGEVFTICDNELGNLARGRNTTEEVLTQFMQDTPVHAIKGIIGDMVRFYTQLVENQKDVVKTHESTAYCYFKELTLGQILPNGRRTAAETSKAPTDKMVSNFLSYGMDGTVENLEIPERRELITRYQESLAALRNLKEVLGKLQNSYQIVEDTYRIAISLNVNEREDRKLTYVMNSQ